MSKLLLMAATLVASNAVMATTVIDVNVMVPKSIVDQDGAEKVFNRHSAPDFAIFSA